MKRDNRRFVRGSGTYKCGDCGKMTRETGEGESQCNMCRRCYMIAGLENSLSDGAITQEQFDKEVALWK